MGRAADPEEAEAEPETSEFAANLARRQRAWVLENNWPEALNSPSDSPDAVHLGGSRVIAPDGSLRFRLPWRRSGIASFTLGADTFDWDEGEPVFGEPPHAPR